MGDVLLLKTIGWMLIGSAALLIALRRLAVPSIVVFVLAGLALGPGLGWIDLTSAFGGGHGTGVSGAIALMSEFGIALLLFLVGLELSLERIRDVGAVAVGAGLGQVLFTAVIGFGLALLLGFTSMESFFLATALTFSSTVVVVKLLGQTGELSSLFGRIAVGIFLVQDLVVIVALTFLAGLHGSTEGLSPGRLAADLGVAFGGMAAMLAFALGASRYLLPRPFAWAASNADMLLIWSLCWCFAFVLAAELLHLSPEIGAFLAGVSLAQLDCAHTLRRRVHPLMNLFVAIFFVTLGAQMQLAEASQHLWPAIVLSLFVLIGNPFIFMLIISRYGYSERTAFKTSVTVAQISEFSFVFVAMGLSAGLVGEAVLAITAVVGLTTIVLSSYMILYSNSLYALCKRWGLLRPFGASQIEEEPPPPERRGHVIVVGMNTLGRLLTSALSERGVPVLAVDIDPQKLARVNVPSVHGDVQYQPLLEECEYTHARLVVSTLQIEDTNNYLAYMCAQAGVPCAIHGFDATVHGALRALGVAHILDSKRAGLEHMAQALQLPKEPA